MTPTEITAFVTEIRELCSRSLPPAWAAQTQAQMAIDLEFAVAARTALPKALDIIEEILKEPNTLEALFAMQDAIPETGVASGFSTALRIVVKELAELRRIKEAAEAMLKEETAEHARTYPKCCSGYAICERETMIMDLEEILAGRGPK